MKQNKRATTLWNKASISYQNYQDYIDQKEDRFKLTIIDLLYISNFKGGNATINESYIIVEKKLLSYSKILIEINNQFRSSSLAELSDKGTENLITKVVSICKLTVKGTEKKIDGFSSSYLSALLNAYFPFLIPILDRRVLINLNLVISKDISSTGQIKNIQKFYPSLIKKMAEISRLNNKNIREIDKQAFTANLILK